MHALTRWLLLVLAAFLALQLFFVLRIALAAWWDPQSTAFQRSEAWRIWHQSAQQRPWKQQWVDYEHISSHLKRAVLTAEDDGFVEHTGVQWEAIEKPGNATRRHLLRPRPAPSLPRFMEAPPSPSSWPRTCCSRVSAAFCARDRSWC